MTTARLIMNAYEARRTPHGSVQIRMHLDGRSNPIPTERVDIRTAADAVAAFNDYKARAGASGLSVRVSAILSQNSRAPRGFRALDLTADLNLQAE